MINSLVSLATPTVSKFRALVAYTTLGGCEALLPRIEAAVGPSWEGLPKTIITSFDFGITEPEAMVYLAKCGFEIRLANLGEGGRLVLAPRASAFHPKAYLFNRNTTVSALVGSANLTRRALTVNVEVAYSVEALDDLEAMEGQWDMAVRNSTPLTNELLDLYRTLRPAALRHPISTEPVPPVSQPRSDELETFSQAVLDGDIAPQEFIAFWVQAGSMSGGSRTQLELPRRANVFFGFSFNDYDSVHHTIGVPPIRVGDTWYSDRPLTWHGDNGMERVNLPTHAQSGLRYVGTVILFRRVEYGFSLEVRAWDSPDASAWRAESGAASHIFRLGERSPRVCGLL